MFGYCAVDQVFMDFDDLKAKGTALGTAAVTVFDKSVDMVAAIRRLSHFYRHESCGQCTPCREGTGWMESILIKLENGEVYAVRFQHLVVILFAPTFLYYYYISHF